MNKKGLKILVNGYIFLVIIALGLLYIFSNNYNEFNRNILVYTTFFVNGIIAILNLIKTDEIGYSIDDMIWIFMLTFMVIAPTLQYSANKFPWGNELIDNSNIVYANLVVLIFMVSFIIFKKYYKIKNYKRFAKYVVFNNDKLVLNLSFIFSIICSFYIVYKVGFANLFSRSTNVLDVNSSSFALIVNTSFRAFPIIAFSIHYIYKDINGRFYSKVKIIILALLFILVNFPTGIARYQMATVYLGCFLVIKKRLKNKYFFKYIILFGLLFIFPIINIFRNNTFTDVLSLNISFSNPSESFLSGDFDSYSMLIRSIKYTALYGLTMGNQLLGNILFFIPRSLWINKPIGSGAFIADHFGWDFTNVSCPFIGEAIINFGIIGVIIFAIVLAYIIKILNFRYKKIIIEGNKKIAIIRILYPFIIGFIFFIMRGDLLSSLSYMIGFCFPAIMLFVIDALFRIKI